ncbi:hypothetical protein [Plantactinospora veratri]
MVSHAAVTGGHVLQGSTYTRLDRAASNRRLIWSHYLSRPGWVETIGKVDIRDVAQGFLGPTYQPQTLNLGAISARLIDGVQSSPGWIGARRSGPSAPGCAGRCCRPPSRAPRRTESSGSSPTRCVPWS